MMRNSLFTIRALSPLHFGIGQGLSDIDLPTAKSFITGHPIIPGSTLKGVLKDEFSTRIGNVPEGANRFDYMKALFGGDGSDEFASAISVGDANLLALPVRSYFGTFAYLVSPYTLSQLKNQLTRVNRTQNIPSIPQIGRTDKTQDYRVMVTKNSLLKSPEIQGRILLEEIDLITVEAIQDVDAWAYLIAKLVFPDSEGWEMFKQHFAIVDDNVLNFLAETALPVDARIAINDETGTVKGGALWYEETIPVETLFMGVVGVDKSYNKKVKADSGQLMNILTGSGTIHCQAGGKATTGKGFVAINFI